MHAGRHHDGEQRKRGFDGRVDVNPDTILELMLLLVAVQLGLVPLALLR